MRTASTYAACSWPWATRAWRSPPGTWRMSTATSAARGGASTRCALWSSRSLVDVYSPWWFGVPLPLTAQELHEPLQRVHEMIDGVRVDPSAAGVSGAGGGRAERRVMAAVGSSYTP